MLRKGSEPRRVGPLQELGERREAALGRPEFPQLLHARKVPTRRSVSFGSEET